MNLSNYNKAPKRVHNTGISFGKILIALVVLGFGLAGVMLIFAVSAPMQTTLTSLFALNSDQTTWYLTRAAGIMAYLLLWLSVVWGLAIPSKLLGNVLSGDFTFDFHQFISLLSLVFLGLHIVVLTIDKYLPFSIAQILVPFRSPYRPLWVSIGILAFYLLVLVTITFYLRKQISMKAFRYIHFASLVAYLGAIVHAFMSGTDSSLPVVMLIYLSTFSMVIFLTAYWLVRLWIYRTTESHRRIKTPTP